MPQYFDDNPLLESKPKTIKYEINGHAFSLKSNLGVFSKDKVDEGTQALLKVLLPRPFQGKILDVGCGYGALGLTLATFFPKAKFVLCDISIRAINLCRENIQELQLRNVICVESDIYSSINEKFDSIVINPPIRAGKKVVYRMFEEAYDYLIDGGSLFIVIRKSHGAKSAQAFIEKMFGNCSLLKKDKGYYIYEAKKDEQKKLRGVPLHE